MSVKLLTENHLEFLSLKGGCTGSSESTLVKMSHCWKSHVASHMYSIDYTDVQACLNLYCLFRFFFAFVGKWELFCPRNETKQVKS